MSIPQMTAQLQINHISAADDVVRAAALLMVHTVVQFWMRHDDALCALMRHLLVVL